MFGFFFVANVDYETMLHVYHSNTPSSQLFFHTRCEPRVFKVFDFVVSQVDKESTIEEVISSLDIRISGSRSDLFFVDIASRGENKKHR